MSTAMLHDLCRHSGVCRTARQSEPRKGDAGNRESRRQIWTQVLALLLAICQLRFESNFPSLSLSICKQGIIIATR